MTTTTADVTHNRSWRGPTLLTVILLSIIYPHYDHLLEYLKTVDPVAVAWSCLLPALRILLASVAVYWIFEDVASQMTLKARKKMNTFLETVVLDDCLRCLFDSNLFSFWLGNSILYTLPTTFAQRAALLHSTGFLPTADDTAAATTTTTTTTTTTDSPENYMDQAQAILCQPGGIKHLLPHALRAWLNAETADQESSKLATLAPEPQQQQQQQYSSRSANHSSIVESPVTISSNPQEASAGSSSSRSSEIDSMNDDTADLGDCGVRDSSSPQTVVHENNDADEWNNHSVRPNASSSATTRRHLPAQEERVLPENLPQSLAMSSYLASTSQQQVVMDILSDIFLKSLEQHLAGKWRFPFSSNTPSLETTLKSVSATTATLLVVQLRCSHRARQVVWSMLQGCVTVGASATLVASLATLQLLLSRKKKQRELDLRHEQPDPSVTREDQPGAVSESQAATLTNGWSAMVMNSIWHQLLVRMIKASKTRRWYASAAFFVMLYLERRRRANMMPPRRSPLTLRRQHEISQI